MQSRRVPILAAGVVVTILAALGLVVAASGQTPQPAASQPSTQPAIYDAMADAKAQIAAAQAKAGRENQRVLVMFGGNWCGWCRKLHGLFQENKDIARLLLYEYQLVLVDVGRFDKHMDVAAGYDIELKKAGVPFLTVLDAGGRVLANQETGALEKGDRHDPQKVTEFLNKWKAEPWDAEQRLADALARAAAEQKLVFLHLGAPWCPWCRRLDAFLAQKESADILGQDFMDLKIDVDRMKNGLAVAKRFRTSDKGGLPWFAFLDAKGQALATSDGPAGNIGYPAAPEEISHFIGMLKKTARRISEAQLARLEQALKDAAPKPTVPGAGGGG